MSSPQLPWTTLWLDTKHYTVPDDILTVEPGITVYTFPQSIRFLHDSFTFHVVKLSKTLIAVYCLRIPRTVVGSPDPGYYLQFQVSFVGFNEESKVLNLYHGQYFTFVIYNIELTYDVRQMNYHYLFDLKVVVKMIERRNIDNYLHERQEYLLQRAKVECQLEEAQVDELAYLVKRPGLSNVFTGRMLPSVAKTKLRLIMRSSIYSNEIAAYIRAKERRDTLPDLDLGSVLGDIATGSTQPISNTNLIIVYMLCNMVGLEFLKELATDLILSRMDDSSLVLESIQMADHVGDMDILEIIAIHFVRHFWSIERSFDFGDVCKTTGWVARSIIHAVRIVIIKNDIFIPGWKPRGTETD